MTPAGEQRAATPDRIMSDLVQRRQAEASAPVAAWRAGVAALAAQERLRASRARLLLRVLIGLGVLAVATVIGLVVSSFKAAPLLLVIVLVGALVAFVGAFVLRQRSRAVDGLAERCDQLIVPLLTILGEDLPPGAPLSLRLDLRGSQRPDTQVGQETLIQESPKISETLYQDPWFTAAGELSDGSRLDLTITDHLRARKVTKRTARGKYKTKQKSRLQSRITVRLALRNDIYQLAAAQPAAVGHDSLTTRPGEKRTLVKLSETVTGDRPATTPTLAQVLDVLAVPYRRVRPALSKGV